MNKRAQTNPSAVIRVDPRLSAATASAGRRSAARSPGWPLLAAAVAFRLWYATFRQLIPDEAFYWDMSRHLQGGYLDHPPLLMALIHWSTLLLGSTEIGVRFVSIFLGFGILLVLLHIARALFSDARPQVFLLLMWLASPLFHGLAGVVTPDTPAIFFSVCGLACALLIACRVEPTAQRPPPPEKAGTAAHSTALPWLAFGLFVGLAMLSKYTTVLLPASVGLALLFDSRGRRELVKPWPWLAALIAALVFSPVLYWNATHQWVSFRYQLGHGLSIKVAANHLKDFGEFIGMQLLLFTPVLFALAAMAMAQSWRRFSKLPLSRRLLLWAATFPLAFFAFAATRSKGEANWPAFGYFPASLLLAEFLAQQHWKGWAMTWTKVGCVVALSITIVLHAPELLYYAHVLRPLPRKLVDTAGWRELGQTIATLRGSRTFYGTPIFCGTHEDAGEIAFYTPGQPDAWCVPLRPQSRATAFEYLPGAPNLDTTPAALLVNADRGEFERRTGMEIIASTRWTRILFGHERDRVIATYVRPMVEATRQPTSAPSTKPTP